MKYSHSDLGNAQLISDLFGNKLKYRADTQQWLHWNGGHHWEILDRDEELRFAAEAAKYRYTFMDHLSVEDQRREAAFALQSQNLTRMQAALAYAKTQEPIKSNGQWDSHPMLLPTVNGVINLANGSLRPGKPEDHITQHTNIPYIPEATCPRWLQYLEEIFPEEPEYRSYIQRAAGYTLTGYTREQVFFLLFGEGENGKSLFREILGALLGDFQQSIRFEAFEGDGNSDAVRDLAELVGTRAAFASETDRQRKLNTSVIKYITGEEPIRTSRKYGHPFTYIPQFKIWMSTNHLPKVDDDSHGFWRRIVLIPFTQTFTGSRRDKFLKDKLYRELPGILNWAVQGAIDWFQNGLQTPDSLLLQVSNYRQSQDSIAKFVSRACILDGNESTTATELYEAYVRWCVAEDEETVTQTRFGKKITEKFTKTRTTMGIQYQGIGLLEQWRVE